MSDDYGYFGSGTEGYAHYVAASGDDDNRGRGGRPPSGKGSGHVGCLIAVIVFVILMFLLDG